MIVDTCQAKNIFGEFDAKSLRKRSAAALFPLLLASKADANHDLKVTMTELNNFSMQLVNKLHDPVGGAQTPPLIAPGTLANFNLPVVNGVVE